MQTLIGYLKVPMIKLGVTSKKRIEPLSLMPLQRNFHSFIIKNPSLLSSFCSEENYYIHLPLPLTTPFETELQKSRLSLHLLRKFLKSILPRRLCYFRQQKIPLFISFSIFYGAKTFVYFQSDNLAFLGKLLSQATYRCL